MPTEGSVVNALHHVRRMIGGAQSHLLHCSDGKYYVVKFQNNPQGIKILANEHIFSGLAGMLGLNVPKSVVVEVSDWLIQQSPELNIQLSGKVVPCESGLQCGSEYVLAPFKGKVFPSLPPEMLGRVRNLKEFAGILVLDKWAGNHDARQAIFYRRSIERRLSACFIDHGYSLGADGWDFRDYPLRGTYPRNEVYCDVRGWGSFEPWLSRIEGLSPDLIWRSVEDTPPAWYQSDRASLEFLAERLFARRGMVRHLIEQFRRSPRNPFPKWRSA